VTRKLLILWSFVVAWLLLAGIREGHGTLVAFIVLVMAAAGLSAWYWLSRPFQRDRRRRTKGLCTRCGYDLRGNVSRVCPECGQPL
jgi:hypothetical protein